MLLSPLFFAHTITLSQSQPPRIGPLLTENRCQLTPIFRPAPLPVHFGHAKRYVLLTFVPTNPPSFIANQKPLVTYINDENGERFISSVQTNPSRSWRAHITISVVVRYFQTAPRLLVAFSLSVFSVCRTEIGRWMQHTTLFNLHQKNSRLSCQQCRRDKAIHHPCTVPYSIPICAIGFVRCTHISSLSPNQHVWTCDITSCTLGHHELLWEKQSGQCCGKISRERFQQTLAVVRARRFTKIHTLRVNIPPSLLLFLSPSHPACRCTLHTIDSNTDCVTLQNVKQGLLQGRARAKSPRMRDTHLLNERATVVRSISYTSDHEDCHLIALP